MFDIVLSRVKIGSIICFLGAICVFISMVQVQDLSKFQFVPVNPIDLHRIFLGVGLSAIGIIVMLIDEVPSGQPNIGGKWKYSVSDCEGHVYSHGGDCEIHQSGGKIRVRGFRRTMKWKDSNGLQEKAVGMPWYTTWASIDDENTLRYEYNMALTDSTNISGFCRIYIPKGKGHPTRMEGHYSLLPPFNHDIQNTRWGTILYEKVT